MRGSFSWLNCECSTHFLDVSARTVLGQIEDDHSDTIVVYASAAASDDWTHYHMVIYGASIAPFLVEYRLRVIGCVAVPHGRSKITNK
jgi:hypothetical protein